MDEVYTCICKNPKWFIHDGFIECCQCGKKYELKAVGGSIPYALDRPSDFNESIRRGRNDKES